MSAGKHLKPFTFYLSKQEKTLVKTLAVHGKTSSAKIIRGLIQNRARSAAKGKIPKVKEHATAVIQQEA